MEIHMSIGDRQIMLILAVIIGVSMVGIVIAYTPSQMGHSPADIGPGTFYGGGNYVFPANSNVNVLGGFAVSGTLNSANIGVTGSLTVGDTINANKINANKITGNTSIVCPPGFTSIELPQGRQLGCIQNTQKAQGTCLSAILDCFNTYGGRTPTYSELYIAFKLFSTSLSNVGTSKEWTSEPSYISNCVQIETAANSFRPTVDGYATNNVNYRCWIPA